MKTPALPYIILITGGIGSGKSVVSRLCRLQGYRVYDCDREAKNLMVRDNIRQELISLLGEDIYDSAGEINSARLSSVLFAEDGIREAVNSLVHKAVLDDVKSQGAKHEGIMLVEAAVASTGLGRLADRIWLVEAPEDIRIERVMTRNSFSKEEIVKRIGAQAPEWEMLDRCKTDIINNDGNASVILRINRLIEEAQQASNPNMNNNLINNQNA